MGKCKGGHVRFGLVKVNLVLDSGVRRSIAENTEQMNNSLPQNAVGRINSLQAARAIAALCVVLYHASVYLEKIRGVADMHAIAGGGRLGTYGVITFFVISGYLMADLVKRYESTAFLVHRLVRIYPIYWLCVAGSTIFFAVVWKLALPDAGYIPAIQQMLVREG